MPFSVIKSAGGNVKGHQTEPGSYLTPSGGTGDGLGGRRTVPTASGARRDDPRRRIRVKQLHDSNEDAQRNASDRADEIIHTAS